MWQYWDISAFGPNSKFDVVCFPMKEYDMKKCDRCLWNSRLAHRVIAHVTCLPTKLLGESGQQITLAFLPSGWISVLLLILGPPTFQIT